MATPLPPTADAPETTPRRRTAPRWLRIALVPALGVQLLLAGLGGRAAAADLRPGEQLPWSRVTLNMAPTIDRDPVELRVVDGWYDASTHLLIGPADVSSKAPLGPLPLDPQRIVKVQLGTFSPQPMPALARKLANEARAKAPAAVTAAKAER